MLFLYRKLLISRQHCVRTALLNKEFLSEHLLVPVLDAAEAVLRTAS